MKGVLRQFLRRLSGRYLRCRDQMKLSERIEQFMANLDELSTGDRVQLRRAVGQRLGEANGAAMMAFYKALPPGRALHPADADAWFAAGCLRCLADAAQPGQEMPLILRSMSKDTDAAEKYQRRLAGLFDTTWSEDGYLLRKISRLAKQMFQTEYTVDCSKLLADLLRWNYTDQSVQRRWASIFFGTDRAEDISTSNRTMEAD